MTLPSGVHESAFKAAIREFTSALGAEQVFTSEDDLALYRDVYTPFRGMPDKEIVASAAVAPVSVEQVQAVVRIANKHRVPLFATSTGRNLGYGGAAPTLSGSVVVDLKRMNRVIEINVTDCYAVLEPGVSFIELSHYLRERNIPLLVSAAENGAGGPVGNSLDHGVGFLGDNFARVCGIEAVLPNGDVIRTGSGAVSNAKLWPVYKYGFGPDVSGLFPQANFGIVTKMIFWLEPEPERMQGFSVSSSKHDDFGPMVDAIQMLRHKGIIRSSGARNPLRGANNSTVGMRSRNIPEVEQLLSRPGDGAASDWDALSIATGIPNSAVNGTVWGPAKIVEATLDHAREHFAKLLPHATFSAGTARDFPLDLTTVPVDQWVGLGMPNLWGFQRLANQGVNRGHYYFSPLFRAHADDIFAMNRTVRKVMADANEPEILKRWGWQGGGGPFPKTYVLYYDFLVYDDASINARHLKLFDRLVKTCADHGWAEYRAPAAFQDLVASVYANNNSALRKFCETMKDAVDPNGILSPGRGGIWPRRYRKE